MEIVAFTIAGILLYLSADWILTQIEIRKGERLANRSVIFFLILTPLALGTFALISMLMN